VHLAFADREIDAVEDFRAFDRGVEVLDIEHDFGFRL
jgi:hypothetical protein